jgi:hypothetical protein
VAERSWRGGLPVRVRQHLPAAAVFAVALATRTIVVARAAGFNAWHGYDESVYYAASAALLHGRVPYHDFVLLHPPVVMLALLPAALLGHWTSDQTGFLAANVGFSVIGAINAVLVVVVARRLGLDTRAATIGGLLYAVWFAPVVAEHSARLEPLGNLVLLLALLALVRALAEDRAPRRRLLMFTAGALFATAANVKIWFVVPLVVALGWVLVVHRHRRAAAQVAIGALAAGAVIDVPFLIASRGEMWRMVVAAQLDRDSAGYPFAVRLADLTSAYSPRPDEVTAGIVTSAVLGMALLIALLALAWRVRPARLVVALAVAMVLTLLLAPVWFEQYADFAAVPIALSAGAAAQALPVRLRLAGWAPALCAGTVTIAVIAQGQFRATVWWGPDAMIRAARDARCVTSDSPAGLVALEALDRDLHNGCAVWVDPIGVGLLYSHAAGSTLATNPLWQRKVVAYLRTGDLAYPYLLRRPRDPRSTADIARDGVALRIHMQGRHFVLYRETCGPPCPGPSHIEVLGRNRRPATTGPARSIR